jgi:Kef-type K+ transport system membrane component KefB
MTNNELSILFFLQLALILVTVRIVGALARKVGQPRVVGEMIAGIVLGPSIFGALAPDLQRDLFPVQSGALIFAVSQLGLVLYMFLIGAEFSAGIVRKRLHVALAVSWAGILAPFLLGCLLAYFMVEDSRFFSANVAAWEAMLFTGAAMAITAFPMLARIIYERGLTQTPLGTLALAAGSIDDAAAWTLLAVVLAGFGQDASIALVAVAGAACYGLLVLFVVRPLLHRLQNSSKEHTALSGESFSLILILLMLGAWFTDLVGIHAVFGAFVLGIAIPRGEMTRSLQRHLEPVAANFLLPLFFVYSGLNTEIGLVTTPALWLVALLVILFATVGKGAACWAAARLAGEGQREALALGTLMNARGMMELILLNIGLERGIITPTLFTIMVIMALVTTLMATPLFELVYGRTIRPPLVIEPQLAELVEPGEPL